MSKEINWASVQPLNGGMSIGYEKALGKPPKFIISNNDANDEHYLNYMNVTRNLNIPVIKMDWDLTEFRTPEDEARFNEYNKDIDIVAFVPVCAGLSMLNCCNNEDSKSRRGDPDNIQNQNMYNLTRFILSKIEPKVAVFENAPAAYTKSGEGVVNYLKDIAKDNEFSLTIEKVDTYDHGIPQHRQRTFLYFWNNKASKFKCAPLIQYEKKDSPRLVDYLNQIPKEASFQDIYPAEKDTALDSTYDYIMATFANEGETVFDVFQREFPNKSTLTGLDFIRNKEGFDNVIKFYEDKASALEPLSEEDEQTELKLKGYLRAVKGYKHCANKVEKGMGYWDSSVVIYSGGDYINAIISKNLFRIVHPEKIRSLNMRELQFLMGLPHDYELLNPKKNWQHVSQSVPTSTAAHTAEQCKLFVLGKLSSSNSSFVRQNNSKQRIDFLSNEFTVQENW